VISVGFKACGETLPGSCFMRRSREGHRFSFSREKTHGGTMYPNHFWGICHAF
jgi:hypothetical protein